MSTMESAMKSAIDKMDKDGIDKIEVSLPGGVPVTVYDANADQPQDQSQPADQSEDPLNPKTRYEEATDDVSSMISSQIKSNPELNSLANVRILPIFDLKKKMTKGQLRIAEVKLANDMLRFLTTNIYEDLPEGVDIIMIIDKMAWRLAGEVDSTDVDNPDPLNTMQARIIRHELRHIMFDVDANKVRLLPHDVEDFAAEVKINKYRPDWGIILAEGAFSRYEEMKGE
jgi:anti-sigma28 factor (negative regulator of flagellin synthesis)